jgi:hypothetical protein
MIRESARRSTPLFVTKGYARYDGDSQIEVEFKGKIYKIEKKRGLDFIGVQEDAPAWAHEEYAEWLKQEKQYEEGVTGG